ncbi:MAG: tetratricopeptide repeat protein [Chitinophagaceae bacterium]|nr:MAG: tetratricopeptide repeat protein [Chitinophagaceae bacterium]
MHEGPDIQKVVALLVEAYATRMHDLRKSILLSSEALVIAKRINDQSLTGKSLSQLSLYYMIMGEYDQSLAMAHDAFVCFNALNDEQGIADTKYNIAGIYYKTNNYHMGLIYLMDCLTIYRKHHDYHNQSRVEKSLGTIYEFCGDQNNAVTSYQNAIDAARKVMDLNLESNAYNNLSGIYLKQQKTEEAFDLIERSIHIKNTTGDTRGLAFAIYGRGKVYTRLGKYEEAEKDFLEAVAIHEQMGERLGLGMTYNKLGVLYAAMGQIEKAKETLTRGLEFSTRYNIVIIKFKCEYQLYRICKMENAHDQALDHLEKYLKEKETVINTQTLKIIENHELISKMRAMEQDTQAQREKAEILEKKNRAEEAMRIRQEFLSTMSHEIRTPLNAVITITSLLREKSNPEEIQLLNSLRFASNNLLRIINDILDFTKLDIGKAQLEMHETAMRPLMENIWHTYESLATEKGIKLALELDDAVADCYVLDATKISQILGNLISNAIKFTELGKVTFVLEKTGGDETSDTLRFSVRDTGEGISFENQQKIFDSFSQIKPITTRKQGGTGLGLAIVKKLVTLFDGNIDVRSEPGKGSVFFFDLRLDRAQMGASSTEDLTMSLRDKTALLAEDNEINAFVAMTLLSKWGITTVHAVNGRQVIEKAAEKAFDFILMDIHMPEMNGFDAAVHIRSTINPNTTTPIFAFTADITAGQEEAMSSCFNGFLWKPLEIDKLHKALSQK